MIAQENILMLEKPDIQDHLILTTVQQAYDLHPARLEFLPLGVDVNAAVYRLVTQDGTAYFLKLRKGPFDELTVAIPQMLKSQGVRAILSPLETRTGRLWSRLEGYTLILYPFIRGKDAYEVELSDRHWVELGATLKGVHSAQVPPDLLHLLPREDYSPRWRQEVKDYQAQIEGESFADPISVKLAEFMRSKRAEIDTLVMRSSQLARDLQARSPELVLCHCDVHPGNLLIGEEEPHDLYLVDWDNPALAPKERDLMFIGAGMGCAWPGGTEEALFYQGYGPTQIDRPAQAYYRYERIVIDVAEFCKQVFLTTGNDEDRAQAIRYLAGSFLPNHVLDVACKTDPEKT